MDVDKLKADIFVKIYCKLIDSKIEPFPAGDKKGLQTTERWTAKLSEDMRACAQMALLAAEEAAKILIPEK